MGFPAASSAPFRKDQGSWKSQEHFSRLRQKPTGRPLWEVKLPHWSHLQCSVKILTYPLLRRTGQLLCGTREPDPSLILFQVAAKRGAPGGNPGTHGRTLGLHAERPGGRDLANLCWPTCPHVHSSSPGVRMILLQNIRGILIKLYPSLFGKQI